MAVRAYRTLIIAALVLVTAACSSPDEKADPETPPTNTAAAAAPTPSTPSTPATTATSTGAAKQSDDDGCPVTTATLLTAFKKVEADYAPTKGFTNLLCHDGYATALQQLVTEGSAEPATVLFKYTATTKSWAVVTAGSSDICDGKGVPEATQKKFPICAS